MHENANSWLCLISFFPFANAINAQGKIYGQREEFGVQRSHLYSLKSKIIGRNMRHLLGSATHKDYNLRYKLSCIMLQITQISNQMYPQPSMKVEFSLKPHVSQAPASKAYFTIASFNQNTFTFYGWSTLIYSIAKWFSISNRIYI